MASSLYALTVEELTPEELAGQMIVVYNADAPLLAKYCIGGIIMFTGMIKDSASVATELAAKQKAMKIPLLVCIDQEGGGVNRLAHIPAFADAPSATKMADMSTQEVTKQGYTTGRFLRAVGINTNFAPCLDPAIGCNSDTVTYMALRERSFNGASQTIVSGAGAFLAGTRSGKCLAFAKHFPGYDVAGNSDKVITRSMASSADITHYIEPFQKLQEQVDGVMMSNIVYENIDTLPAVLSPRIVGMAREIYPQKIIITDDLWAVSVRQIVEPNISGFKHATPDSLFAKLVTLAVEAGNDMLLITHMGKVATMVDAIMAYMAVSPQNTEQVKRSVQRILSLKEKLK